MRDTAIIQFTGNLDGDTDPRVMAKGDYIYAENLFSSDRNTPGAISNELGSAQVFYTLPTGTNTCIGMAEDSQKQSLVYFIKNSNLDHRILRWFPGSGNIYTVAAGAYLGLDASVHSAHVIDGDILVWTDGITLSFDIGSGILGKEPRKLDMGKSVVENKALSYELYAGLPGNAQFAEDDTIRLIKKDLDGAPTLFDITFTVPDDTMRGNPAAGLAWLAQKIRDSGMIGFLTIEECDCKLILTSIQWFEKLEMISSSPQLLLVPKNHYAPVLSDMKTHQIALKREPLDCAPIPEYTGVSGISYNNVRDGCFQFRSRVIYDTGERSSWSAVSYTALNNAQYGPPQQSLNGIHLDFTDDRLNDVSWLCMITHVELAFRDGNDSNFRLIKRIPMCEIGSITQEFIFLNDGLYSEIGSDDLSVTSGDAQVLTNYFPVPRFCGAIAPIAAEDGNLRLALGATVEGFNRPECVDADLIAGVYGQTDLVDIVGTVDIVNDARAFDTAMRFPNYTLDGFVVYLAGTNYFGVSDNPLDGTGTGAFTIKNVPRGVYSLRVASYLCRFDDSFGPRYNLQNGTEWQRTSSPVIDCAGSVVANGFKGERTINLYGTTDPTFDLDAEPLFGPIQIQNCHNASATPGAGTIRLVEAYCLDNDGVWDTLTARTSATSVERRNMQFRVGSAAGFLAPGDPTFPSPTALADHNGYAFASIRLDILSGVDRIRPVISTWGGNDAAAAQPYHVYAAPSTVPESDGKNDGFKGIFADTAIDYQGLGGTNSNTVPFETVLKALTMFCYQHDPAWTLETKATISGRVIDQNGTGVSNVLIWMVANGRFEYTNDAGEFSIRTYGIEGGTRSFRQLLFPTYLADAAGDNPFTPASDGVVFTLDADGDGIADEHVTADFVLPVIGGIIWDNRFVKSGGIYKGAVVYEDEAGRQCGISLINTIRVPFHTTDGQFVPRSLSFSINSLPPLEAVRYRILRTKDTFYLTHRTSPVGGALYAIIPDGASTPTFTTYSSGNATHILLKVPATTEDPAVPAGTLLLMFRSPRVDGYRAKFGDRVRYLLDNKDKTVFDDRMIEVDVLGEYIDGPDYYVVVPYSEIAREVIAGWTFEFFTPKGFEEEIYYETGVCLPIDIDPGFGRYHKGITQDQNPITGVPATGPILSGDTYWWREEVVFSGDFSKPILCEHYRRSQFVTGKCEDIGRPYLYDPLFKATMFENRIRISGLYASNSLINDLHSFGVLDYQALNRTFGPIRWLGMVHNSLLAICTNRVQPIYVGKGRMIDLSGNSLVGRADQILNVGDEVMINGGTLNPESVLVEDGRAYFWDLQNGVFWQYAQNGLTDIGRGRKRYFYDRHVERLPLARTGDIVITGYDRKHDLVVLSFQPGSYTIEGSTVNMLNDTLCYSPKDGGWKTHLTWHPQAMGSVNEDFMTFFNGALYRSWKAFVYNYFHNSYHESAITFPVNDKPVTMKDWHSIRLRANKQWFSPKIFTLPDAEYSAGMKSRIMSARWVQQEGWFAADFLRDANDPHAEFLAIANVPIRESTAMLRGRPLKGDVLIAKIQALFRSQQNILFAATVDYGDSQISV